MPWLDPTLRWYGLLLLISLCWAPWVRLLCDRLTDRGATVVRPIALLGTIYPAWLLASLSLVPLTSNVLWLTLAVAGVGGWGLVLWRRHADRGWLLALIAAEFIAVVAFAGYIWLRGFTPEILHTEKPMEAAFLMSSSITSVVPPPDPWFAGEPINYYYLGYLIHGSLSRLADIPGTTGFNLALATTFSAACTAAAGLGWNVVRRWHSRLAAFVGAAAAAVLTMFVGNLYAAIQIVQSPAETLAAGWWDKLHGVGWRASRIVCDTVRVNNDCAFPDETINEFPAFSFILGDLHPHVLALPFAITALSLAFNLLGRFSDQHSRARGNDWVRYGVTGAFIGSLYALNSWDFPTYLLIAVLAACWGGGRSWRPALVLIAFALVAWAPFFLSFAPPTGGSLEQLPDVIRNVPVLPRLLGTLAFHTGDRTSASEFLTMFGVPYAIGTWLLASGRGREPWVRVDESVVRWAMVTGMLAVIATIVLAAPLIVLCGVPLAVAGVRLHRSPATSARTVATAFFGLGLVLVLGTEFVFFRDAFQTRMNTLFKVYYQAWVLFAVMAALALVVIWVENRSRSMTRAAVVGLASVGLIAGLVYPVLSTRQWTGEFAAWSGLDGIAYLEALSADELAAIGWLQANSRPTDVLLEAGGCSYQVNGGMPLNRASAFSGVPTVIGWSGHERQWRSGQPALLDEIPLRERQIAEIFADPSGASAADHGITLLYIGTFETGDWRHVCAAAGPYAGIQESDFPGPGWEIAFSQGDVTIYRRAGPTAAARIEG
jgi:YYY domain-containing protein